MSGFEESGDSNELLRGPKAGQSREVRIPWSQGRSWNANNANIASAYFESLADHSPLFIGMCDLDFIPFYINEAGRRLVGLEDLKQFQSIPVREFFFPEDQAFILGEFFPRVLKEGRAETEIRFRHFKTGEAIWMTYDVFFLSDESGNPVGLATVSRDISERKRIEEAYRDRKRQLDMLARASQLLNLGDRSKSKMLTTIFDELGRIVEMESWFHYRLADEPRMLRLEASTGTSEEERRFFATMAFGTLLCGRVAETRRRLIIEDLANSGQEGSEVLAAAGSTSYIGFPLLANGTLLGTIAFVSRRRTHFRDGELQMIQTICDQIAITLEHARLERELRESEERLRLFVEHAPAGVAMFDMEMRYLVASRRWMNDYGLSEPLIGRCHYELFPELPERWKDVHRRVLAGEYFSAEDDRFERPDGTVQYVRWEALPWRTAKGGIGGLLIAAEEITARKLADEGLRESEERQHLALSAGKLATWDWDMSCGKMTWNDAQFEALGYEVGEVEPSFDAWASRVHPDDREKTMELFMHAMEERGEYKADYRILWPNGTVRWTDGRGLFHYDEQGRPKRSFGVTMDLTDRKRAEAALKEADRRKDEFIATLAHELRNPLAPIRNGLAVLRRSGELGPPRERVQAMMERQVDQLVRLVDDLLEISRISHGKIELRKDQVNLADIVGHAIDMSQCLIEAGGLELRIDLPNTPLAFEGDTVRLTQIFANLLNNAAKYTNRGGRIDVTAQRVDDSAVVTVADAGLGIAKEMLPRVFDLFVQVDDARDISKGGLGIGLALVRNLVELHGGTVEAHSEGKGRGSRFVVRLPILAKGETVATPLQATAPAPSECVATCADRR